MIRRWWQRISSAVGRAAGRVYRLPGLYGVLGSFGRALRAFIVDDCAVMAAAISFFALLSLIPFVLLLLSIAGYLMEHLGGQADRYELFAHLAGYIRAVFPFSSEELIERLRAVVINRRAFGLTGLVFMVVTASLVFRSLELAFARVLGTRRRRSLMAHQLLFGVFGLAIGLLFLGIHSLTVVGHGVAPNDLESFLAEHAGLRFAFSLLVASLVFFVLLKYFSRERVRSRASLAGGALFALLWTLAGKVFGAYLGGLARFSLLYGSLAAPAVLMVWIFYTACILLLCTEFAQQLQQRYWPLPLANDGAAATAAAGPAQHLSRASADRDEL